MRFRTRHAAADGRHGPSRAWRRAFAAVAAVVVAFGVVTARLFVWPAQGMPARVSAIVMLAGPGDRLPVALQLAREHRAPVLVVSRGWQGYGGPCPPPVPGVKLICFDPDPGTTRGEAEALGRLAKQYRWSSVVLVTTRPQDTRARITGGALLRWLDLCGHGAAAAEQLALPDRLRMGSAAQGTGRLPGLLSRPTPAAWPRQPAAGRAGPGTT